MGFKPQKIGHSGKFNYQKIEKAIKIQLFQFIKLI